MGILSLFILKIIIVLSIINSYLNYCNNKSLPIFLPLNNTCVIQYCKEEDFINEICIKDNDIIKTQWLNNIIDFGVEKCRYIKIGTFSTGEMIVFSGYKSPYFYGLNKDGRFLFNEDGKETPYNNKLSLDLPSQMASLISYKYGELFIVKIGQDEKEYLLNFGYKDLFTELYDFDNKNIIYKQTKNVFNSKILYSIRSSIYNLKESDNFLFAGIFNLKDESNTYKNYLILFTLNLPQKESLSRDTQLVKGNSENIEAFGNMVSCFQGGSKHIMCFFIYSLDDKQYKIIIYDENLGKVGEDFIIPTNLMEENIFFKVVHFEGETGFYFYFDLIDNKGPYPIILIKHRIKENKIEDFEEFNNNKIQLKLYNYDTDLCFNDFIKLSDEFVCFSSVSTDKEILYIITLNIFIENIKKKIKIRYYIINIFGLYNYKFYSDLTLGIYKESLVLASNFCKQKECEGSNKYYSSLIIFSYPNSVDVTKDLIDVLIEKNEIINNINFKLNLTDYTIIDNNIFGMIFKKIIIKSIDNCNNIQLMTSKDNTEIYNNYEIFKNEYIYISLLIIIIICLIVQ